MSGFNQLWNKLAKSKKYREEFVAAQVKRGIPFQIRRLMKQKDLSQQKLASRAGLTQGVVSRAADPEYGNLTLNTIIRIAAGFDVAFMGRFEPFSELGRWFMNLSEESEIKTFNEENLEIQKQGSASHLKDILPSIPQGESSQEKKLEPLFELSRDRPAALFSVPKKGVGHLAGIFQAEPIQAQAAQR